MNRSELVPMTALGGRIMPKTLARSSRALALLAVLLAPEVAMSQTSPASDTSGASKHSAAALHDGVVVDTVRGAAYIKSPQGGIDALDLTTGNVMWKSQVAVKPLLVKDGALIAQADPGATGELAIVTLDSRQGAEQARVRLGRPQGLRARATDAPSQSFRLKAFQAGNDVVVTWSAHDGRRFQGVLPPESDAAPTVGPASASAVSNVATRTNSLRGAARLDFVAGRAIPMTYEGAEGLRSQTRTARTGLTADSVRQLSSLDGKHTLRTERLGDSQPFASYRWTISDAAGVTVGTVDAPVSMAPFVVSGTRILYVARPATRNEGGKVAQQPLRLRSLDLRTGAGMWEAPVVDGAYRGPFPP